MLMNPLPDVDTAFSMLIQQEREIAYSILDPITHDAPEVESSTALLANSNYGNQNGKSNFYGKGRGHATKSALKGHNRLCTHCNRTNHTIETCWLKHGYPPGYKNKGKNFSQSSHTVAVVDSSTQPDSLSFNAATPPFGLTQDQYNGILSIFQQSKSQSTPAVNSVSTTTPLALHSQSSTGNGKSPNFWILDTGATDHITYDIRLFSTHRHINPIPVSLPNGTQTFADISGTVQILPSLILHNVLYIPSFHVNLISVNKLVTTNNCFVNITSQSCEILQIGTKAVIGIAKLQRGLYVISTADHTGFVSSTCNSVSSSSFLWHLRLGHLSDKGLQAVSRQFPFVPSKNNMSSCDSCHFAKQRKLPFPHSMSKSNAPFDILHADLWGPYSTISLQGHKYFLTLVDDYSRFTWVIFLKSKDETRKSLIHFVAYIENQFHTTLKCLRSDNGTEFSMGDFFLSKGIIHQKTCVETPQQNGVVERKHQHILNVARSLSFHSHIPLTMWNFCIQHAVHIINRLPTPLLNFKCPYELLHNEPPSLVHLKVFGCLSYATTLQAHRTKFDSRARKAIFLGYKDGTKGYILYDLNSHEIFVSRNVIFYEFDFPFHLSNSVETDSASSASHLHHTSLADPDLDPNSLSIPVMLEPDLTLSPIISPNSNDSTPITSPESSPIPNPVPLRRSSRISNPPRHLEDFHCNTVIGTHSTISSNNVYPLSSVLSYNNCAPDYHAFCCSILAIVEPKTYTQASKFECWKNAMNAELLALDENKTWSVVYLPRGKVPVGCK
jgi:hypothetical protein